MNEIGEKGICHRFMKGSGDIAGIFVGVREDLGERKPEIPMPFLPKIAENTRKWVILLKSSPKEKLKPKPR